MSAVIDTSSLIIPSQYPSIDCGGILSSTLNSTASPFPVVPASLQANLSDQGMSFDAAVANASALTALAEKQDEQEAAGASAVTLNENSTYVGADGSVGTYSITGGIVSYKSFLPNYPTTVQNNNTYNATDPSEINDYKNRYIS